MSTSESPGVEPPLSPPGPSLSRSVEGDATAERQTSPAISRRGFLAGVGATAVQVGSPNDPETGPGPTASPAALNGTNTSGPNGTAPNGTARRRAPYETVHGSYTKTLENGETLQNTLIRADGHRVKITLHGGASIRNVAITGASNPDAVVDIAVRDPRQRAVVQNVYFGDIAHNAMFVGPSNAGTVYIDRVAGIRVGEDLLYASPAGNEKYPTWNKVPGANGPVHVSRSYGFDVGNGEPGYVFRLGSDGSSVTDSTIVNADVGVANLYALDGGVTFANVDIVDTNVPVRLGRARYGDQLRKPTRTAVRNVRIGSAQPQLNDYQGQAPIVRGHFSHARPDPRSPKGVPLTPERAASGVGGGPIPAGGGGTVTVVPIAEIVSVVMVIVLGVVLAVVVGATVLIAWLEQQTETGGLL